ncbi:nitroreductase/quinone reductase family protein [Streptomyces sp. NPDC096094]|uniref:nitroreductase/quinone reductase family protein n=1 Tax=Streptomyces sp. NPDC096094 TaxID=3366073 RepID=UPI0037FB6CC6
MTASRSATEHYADRRQRLLRMVGNSRVLRRWGPWLLPLLDRRFHRWTNGHWTPSRLLAPVLILHTTRRDGTPCATPLLAGRTAPDTFFVMATNFGRPRHPAWSHHLLRDPHARVDWQGASWPVRARLLTPQEQQAARPRILACMPCFDDYARTAEREIRVFALTPPGTAQAYTRRKPGRRRRPPSGRR